MGKFRRIGSLLLGLVVLSTTSGFKPTRPVDPNDPQLASYFVQANDAVMRQVVGRFEVATRFQNGYEVIVPAVRANELLALVPKARLLDEDLSASARALVNQSSRFQDAYHDFPKVEQHLRAIVAAHPDVARLETYGKSKEGRPLYVLKLSENVSRSDNEPNILITGGTHGDELIGIETLFGVLDYLVANYKSQSRIAALLKTRQIWFVPVVNPDGFVRKQRYANGVDPNREYPYPLKPNRTPNEAIAAMMQFVATHAIKSVLDFHAFSELVVYPWAYTKESAPSKDEEAFRALSGYMAQASGYRFGQVSKIMYIAPGCSTDYFYWKHHILSVTVEVGKSKIPDPSQIPVVVKQNLESTVRFLEKSVSN